MCPHQESNLELLLRRELLYPFNYVGVSLPILYHKPVDLLIVFIIGLAASFFGSLVSGGLALFALSGLLATGLSPLLALGTFRVGAAGFTLGGLYKYKKANKIVWKLVPYMTVAGLLGAYIGANLIISLDESVLERIIGFAILLFIPFSIFRPKLGVVSKVVSTKSVLLGHVFYFFASIWGGAVAVGTGIVSVYPMMHFYGLTLLQVKGTNRLPTLAKVLVILFVFNSYGLIDWEIGLIFALGMFIGGSAGAHYAIKLGDSNLRWILLAFVAILSLKLILGL